MKTMNKTEMKSMKKFVIREAETLKTTAAAAYCLTCC
jgi:hypothetical protein